MAHRRLIDLRATDLLLDVLDFVDDGGHGWRWWFKGSTADRGAHALAPVVVRTDDRQTVKAVVCLCGDRERVWKHASGGGSKGEAP